MAETQEIPINSDEASFKIRTVLEDTQYVLRFDWNSREERWILGIYDALEAPIVVGLALAINNELIERFELEALPPGRLMLYDATGGTEEAGRDDLGKRCRLLYRTS